MEKSYKHEMVGKANIFDRYAYLCAKAFQIQMYLALKVASVAGEFTPSDLTVCLNEIEKLRQQIEQLSEKDRTFLLIDSIIYCNYTISGEDDLNFELNYFCKRMETEYTQSPPRISSELEKRLNVNED